MYSLNGESFDNIALDLFRFQSQHNPVYRRYINYLGVDTAAVHNVIDIPYLPISFFKHHQIKTGDWREEFVFTSSGTSSSNTSSHFIPSRMNYLENAVRCFRHFFGELENYHFMALLPGYLERQGSSLVSMIDHFIKRSNSHYSGFYLYETKKLLNDLDRLKESDRKTIVWGVTFALLELAETSQPDLSHCIVIETGGMKGRRAEITREELHKQLVRAFNIQNVHSEYGMTELLSQAYSTGDGIFHCPPGMKVICRDLADPFHKSESGSGALNVIDLANHHSVAFIETEDVGRVLSDGGFEVFGRMDNSDVRGCSLLLE